MTTGFGYLRPAIPLAGLLAVALALRLVFFIGFVGSDDSVYLEAAADLAERGYWTGQDLASSRIGFVAVAAAALSLFGFREFGTIFVSLIAALVTHVLVYALGRLYFGHRAALLAVALLAFYPLNIVLSTMLLPETVLSCLLAGALLVYEIGQRAHTRPRMLASLAAGLLLGLAYLVKEPAVLVLGAIGTTWAAIWLRSRRIELAWVAVVGGFALLLAGEALVRYLATGTPWGRFQISAQAVAQGQVLSSLEREQSVWYLYLRSMFVSLYGVGLLFYLLVGATAWAWARQLRPPLVLVCWLVVVLGYLSLGSVSLTSYVPLPKQPRYLEAVTVPAVLLAGGALASVAASGTIGRGIAWASLAAYAAVGVLCAQVTSALERWRFEPVRAAYRWLDGSGLTPVHASPRLANGLYQLSGTKWVVLQSRAEACGDNNRTVLALWLIVGRAPAGRPPRAPRGEEDCQLWTLRHRLEVSPPVVVMESLGMARRVLSRAPVPNALKAKILRTVETHEATVVLLIFLPAAPGPR
jgi:4-amino-4-deoxy-L-arabinose transferase-like glycosyltransferase